MDQALTGSAAATYTTKTGQVADQAADQGGRPMQMTVNAAAATLGISPDAVRNRLKRGTLERRKLGRRVYVLLDPSATNTDQAATKPRPTEPTNKATNGLEAVVKAKDEEIARLVAQVERTHSDLERAGDEKTKLLEALQAGQVLQKQTANHLDRLQAQIEGPKRASWFSRLLGKGPTTALVLAAMVSVVTLSADAADNLRACQVAV